MKGRYTVAEKKLVDSLVEKFKPDVKAFDAMAQSVLLQINALAELKPLIHFTKYRVKDPEHLRDKLYRKIDDAKSAGKGFEIDRTNLYERITDLAGVRLLHLHTDQMAVIHPLLLKVFKDNLYDLVEDPTAHTWDDEYKAYFENLAIKVKPRLSMYTSVHYTVAANNRSRFRCEIQVRTLMEEVWGEVSHALTYPHETDSMACREQLKVLARVTSSGTRLVDSIYKSYDEHGRLTAAAKAGKKK